MDKKMLEQLKAKLLEHKAKAEAELATFTEKDIKVAGDYDTRFPDLGQIQSPDEAALKVATYDSALPIEYALELRLVEINKALEKIAGGTYGVCENCQEPIDPKRLDIMPEAKACLKCHKK